MGADAFRTAHSIHHPENPPFPPALHNAIVAVQSICQQCNLSADSAYMHDACKSSRLLEFDTSRSFTVLNDKTAEKRSL